MVFLSSGWVFTFFHTLHLAALVLLIFTTLVLLCMNMNNNIFSPLAFYTIGHKNNNNDTYIAQIGRCSKCVKYVVYCCLYYCSCCYTQQTCCQSDPFRSREHSEAVAGYGMQLTMVVGDMPSGLHDVWLQTVMEHTH